MAGSESLLQKPPNYIQKGPFLFIVDYLCANYVASTSSLRMVVIRCDILGTALMKKVRIARNVRAGQPIQQHTVLENTIFQFGSQMLLLQIFSFNWG
ncbi:hypothetical protein CXU17_04625 [Akkermansia muciniphila]|nr:hypothetical protein CXU17_04625 [Akkermansia muciniphila]